MMNKGLLSLAAAMAVVCYAFYRFEKGRFSSKEISLIAVLAAIAAVGRIPFAALPNVQPTTFFVMISGFVFGPAAGFLVGAVAAFSSNLFLGHGPWTIWQMLAWGACGASSGVLGLLMPRAGRMTLAVFSVLWGYLFGWVMNFWYWYSFVYPLTISSWVAVNAASFYFDTLHAAGNAAFFLFLGNGCISAMRYFKKRLELSYITG
ncbi:MAG: ECF transporter S component [Candidatus Aureabacteria bacterium]|nr:ECF transporter S component [Candidatus Auribacterota bacterium]